MTLGEKAAGNARAVVLVLFGLACAVLLIACANVATLTLARATSRGRELALRAALGAGRGRLIRLLVLEGLALGVAGSVGGASFAWAGLTLLARVLPPDALPPHAVLDVSIADAGVRARRVAAVGPGLGADTRPPDERGRADQRPRATAGRWPGRRRAGAPVTRWCRRKSLSRCCCWSPRGCSDARCSRCGRYISASSPPASWR